MSTYAPAVLLCMPMKSKWFEVRTTVATITVAAALGLMTACELEESPGSGFPRTAPTIQAAPTVQAAPTIQAAPTYQAAPTFQPGQPAQLEVPAPVEGVEIVISGGQGSDADLVLLTGLPNACYDLGSYSVDESTSIIVVEVINLKSGGNLACAEIYLTEETRVPLEQSIEACANYDVRVNDETYKVQATEPGRRCR